MRVALITAVYGGYDKVRDLPEDHGFDDAVCVTDSREPVGSGWRVHYEPSEASPRLAAKRPKMMPWLYTDCDAAVWLDASFEIVGAWSRFAREHLERDDFVVWKHPEGRVCIGQEADVCWFFKKYEGQPIREQVAHYFRSGMPQFWGLFACGALGYRFTPEVRKLGAAWYRECMDWSIQDQISLPFVLWRSGHKFGLWRANEYDNPFLRLHWGERTDWGAVEGFTAPSGVVTPA